MTPRAPLAPARLAGATVLRSQSDERLVDLCRAGHEPAFDAIVVRYRATLLRYASGLLTEARAEDALQQAFVSAHQAICRDDTQLNLQPWLFRIVHNSALNALRDSGPAHEELDDNFDGVERPDQAFERRERLREVIAGIQALPDRQRDAIVLRELEGRSYKEIAAELNASDGAVRQLLNRARNTMRAGVTAVTPAAVLLRLPGDTLDPVGGRAAELVAGTGTAAVAAKVCATVLVAGSVTGGAIGLTHDRDPADAGRQAQVGQSAIASALAGPASPAIERAKTESGAEGGDASERRGRNRSGRREEGSGSDGSDGSGRRGDHGGDSSGPGDGGDDDGDGSHGSDGPGEVEDPSGGGGDSSGPGSDSLDSESSDSESLDPVEADSSGAGSGSVETETDSD